MTNDMTAGRLLSASIIFGLFTSFAMELVVYPAVFLLGKWHGDMKKGSVVPEASGLHVVED